MKDQSALLIIDMQWGMFADESPEDKPILDCIQGLLKKARIEGIPVLYMQHDGGPGHPLAGGTEGWKIHPHLAPQEHEIVIGKQASDSFYETPLHEKLQELGVQRLVVTGAATDYCVDTTCRRAASYNYDVLLVADGHATGGDGTLTAEQIIAHHNHVLSQMAHPTHPIKVLPAAEVVF